MLLNKHSPVCLSPQISQLLWSVCVAKVCISPSDFSCHLTFHPHHRHPTQLRSNVSIRRRRPSRCRRESTTCNLVARLLANCARCETCAFSATAVAAMTAVAAIVVLPLNTVRPHERKRCPSVVILVEHRHRCLRAGTRRCHVRLCAAKSNAATATGMKLPATTCCKHQK